MDDIFIATPMFGGMCHGSYATSLAVTLATFINKGLPLRIGYVMNESLVTRARDSLVHDFLGTNCTHLMFIDSDIGFRGEDVLSLLDADKDVICGVYPRKEVDWESVALAVGRGVLVSELPRFTGSLVVNGLDGVPVVRVGREPVEVASAGAGFMLVKRRVFAGLEARAPLYWRDGVAFRQFFDTGIDPVSQELLPEDFHFCAVVRGAGFSVWVAPWVQLTHTGSFEFRGCL